MSNYQTSNREGHGLGYTVPQLEQSLYAAVERARVAEARVAQLEMLTDNIFGLLYNPYSESFDPNQYREAQDAIDAIRDEMRRRHPSAQRLQQEQ